jgi:succinoglycan biosynthesis transport protein ExoP
VLIIDADLRWPTVHEVVGIPNGPGLSEALIDAQSDLAYVQLSERLAVLTAGSPGPTPLAGLSSPRMGTILEECTAAFDWVLVDTPPVGLMPDAQLLARHTGGVLLVIGAGSTPASAVEKVVVDLGPECIVGTVLNRVESHRIAEHGYYYRYAARTGESNSSTNP